MSSAGLTQEDFHRVAAVMAVAWAPSTLETYGAGLLMYHAICDAKSIPEALRAPVSRDLLSVFIAELAGTYLASAISNYVAGVQAWHRLHRLPWTVDAAEQHLLVRGAASLVRQHDSVATPASRISRDDRLPVTVGLLSQARAHLDLQVSLDAAVFSCATAMLYSVARPGELTVPSQHGFDPALHVSVTGLARSVTDSQGNAVSTLFVPSTKCSPGGETLFWGAQLDDTDPEWALDNHLKVNSPQPGEHLFAHVARDRSGVLTRRPLTSQAFMKRFQEALQAAGVRDKYSAHGFRIGGTLEYLLRGLPFAVVRTKGRWAGNSFQLYLRRHELILAPYMQANPAAWRSLLVGELPPVR